MKRLSALTALLLMSGCNPRVGDNVYRYSDVLINPATAEGVAALALRHDAISGQLLSAEKLGTPSMSNEVSRASFVLNESGGDRRITLLYGHSFPFADRLMPGTEWLFYFTEDGRWESIKPK